MTDTFEPPYSQWREILTHNIASRAAREEKLGHKRVAAIREGVLAIAESYSAEIVDTAKRSGIIGFTHPELHVARAPVIAMGGHQPVVYHPGLISKAQALSRFAKEANAVAINVVIDTDEGDGGVIVWPRVSQAGLELRRRSVSEKGGEGSLYRAQRVASSDVVREVFAEMEADLLQSGLFEAAAQVRTAGALYQQLAGEPIAAAHAIVRWAIDGSAALELPLSALVQESELGDLLQEFATDGERLTLTYNASLESYRKEHRIHNPANPFPNMRSSEQGLEVPLWRVAGNAREPLYLSDNSLASDGSTSFLAPRGSITTMLLRGFCSDIFIHGLGGGKYDRFVDQFAASYLGVVLPAYVVASRTWQLFPERVAEIQRSLELASKMKEIISKTEGFLGVGIFSPDEESVLQRLIAERSGLRESLQKAASPEERSAASHALNAANREVRAVIERSGLQQHVAHAAANEAALARWSFREFPFFLYRLPRSA